jgi:microcystin-dependent protein
MAITSNWLRWNTTSHIFEYSTDNGATYVPLPLNASILNEGTLNPAVIPGGGGGAVPAGSIMAFGGSAAPTGYLLCDGAAVSRTTYAALFAAISTTYGTGDGASTFNLPNLQQRFPLGKAASGTGAALGSSGGNIDHTHLAPLHNHTVPTHTHPLSGSAAADSVNTFSAVGSGTLVSRSTHVHTVTGTATAQTAANTGDGGNAATDAKNPPFLTVNYIIKT